MRLIVLLADLIVAALLIDSAITNRTIKEVATGQPAGTSSDTWTGSEDLGLGAITAANAATSSAAAAGTDTSTPAATKGGEQVGQVSMADLVTIGAKYGWNATQLKDWMTVIYDESRGNPNAVNPGSGAYGIGQFLGTTKTEYAPYGATSNNVMDQLEAMAKYIHDRYQNDPTVALEHENTHGWY